MTVLPPPRATAKTSSLGQSAASKATATDATDAAKKVDVVRANVNGDASEAKSDANVFAGVTAEKIDAPIPQETGDKAPLQARLKAPTDLDAVPKVPTLDQSLDALLPPALAEKAKASGAKDVLSALQAIPDADLMALLSHRFSAHEKASTAGERPRLQLGVQFVDVGRLVPGQTRISIDRVREKVATQIEFGGHTVRPNDAVQLGYGEGTATVPLHRPKPAIAGPGGQVLVIDGNHQAVASILAGAKTTPIDIVADHQDLTPEAFAKLADQNGWVYLNEIGGAEATSAPTYASLTNDPVRFLMSEAAFKASHDATGQVVFEETDRPQTRAWVKLAGKTVDFVEFILADILYRAAEADPALKSKLLATDDAELQTRGPAVREALNAAIDRGTLDPEALGIKILPAAVESKIDLEALAHEVDSLLQPSGA